MHDKPLTRRKSHLLAEGLDDVFFILGGFLVFARQDLLGSVHNLSRQDLLGFHLVNDRFHDNLVNDNLNDGLSEDLLDDRVSIGRGDATLSLEDKRRCRRLGGVSRLGCGEVGHGCQGSWNRALIRR